MVSQQHSLKNLELQLEVVVVRLSNMINCYLLVSVDSFNCLILCFFLVFSDLCVNSSCFVYLGPLVDFNV